MEKSVGLKLISSLLSTGDLKEFSKSDVNPLTLKPHELECWDYITNFIYQHKAMPLRETVLQELGDITLPLAKEVPSYYAEQVRQRFISDTCKKGFTDIKPHLTKEGMDVDRAIEILTDTLMEVHTATHRTDLVDFKDSAEFLAKAYKEKKIAGMDKTVLMGYPSIDTLSGGMVGGDLISIVGRPAMGKTWHTLYIAHNAWYRQKKTVLYVTLEMKILAIEQRLASMHTKHSLTQIKKAQLSTKHHKDFFSKLETLSDTKQSLWVAGGDIAATVDEIWKLVMQVNPDFVVIDGAYLLSNPNPRLGKYERVAENARAIKQRIAMDFNIPVLTSWQFNRTASKKMEKSKDNKAGLEDIGYTDEIGQLSSVVLGLMQEESIETIITRQVDVLKGRDGEVGTFFTKWDFFNMDFAELVKYEEQQEEHEQEQELVVN